MTDVRPGQAAKRSFARAAAEVAFPLWVVRGRREVSAGRADGFIAPRAARLALGDAVWGDLDVARIVRPVDQAALGDRDGADDPARAPFVRSGQWDTSAVTFGDDPRYEPVGDLIDAGLRYRDIPAYHRMLADVAAGRRVQRGRTAIKTPEGVDRYWEGYVALIRSIQREGYQQHVGDEVGVAVGRTGEVLKFSGGNHRFAVARHLGLPSIRVRVRFVHVQWLDDHAGPMCSAAAVRRALRSCF